MSPQAASEGTDKAAVESLLKVAAAEAADRRGRHMEGELQQMREAFAKGTADLRAAKASLAEFDSSMRALKAENAALRREIATKDARLKESAAEAASLRCPLLLSMLSHCFLPGSFSCLCPMRPPLPPNVLLPTLLPSSS